MEKFNGVAVNDVVQITDDTHAWYPCFLLVTAVKTWGVQACAFIPISNDGSNRPGEAYNRLRWEQVEKVGTAIIVPGPFEEPH